jgi:aminopeptidase N
MALVESIVAGFYPRGLASAELRDATQAWLDAHSDASDALRRIVAENRDPITRALAAQERDARA